MTIALVGSAFAEPPVPSGYNYATPVVGTDSGSLGQGGYTDVGVGHQTSEGLIVDDVLLAKIKEVLLHEEMSAAGGSQGVSSVYGPPVYGPPATGGKVIGIDLEGVKQAIQVAEYLKNEQASVHLTPSGSYGPPQMPSGLYGAP